MSFRWFIYYCALCGAWAALLGWLLGRTLTVEEALPDAGLKGLCLGLFVSLALSLVDALWNVSSLRQLGLAVMGVTAAVVVGSLGGMMGGLIGQLLFGWKPLALFLIFGWTLTGLLIGFSIGVFDVLRCFLRQEDPVGALRKIVNGTLGGALGGLLGGALTVLLHRLLSDSFGDKPSELMWSPSATGFVALGLCIGLLIGLAQIILKEAWIKVESGRRAGKELLISKPELTIGRAEACDLGLFGDHAVEKRHARIRRSREGYLLDDLDTPGGTFLNEQRIHGSTPLASGDAIRVGNCILRFGERAQRRR